jgi:hypothetical protein
MKLKELLAEKRREGMLFNQIVVICKSPILASFSVDALFFMVDTLGSPSFLVMDMW